MSFQNVIAFIEKVGDDAELYATVKQLPPGSLEHLQETALAHGLPFSQVQWREAMAQVTGPLEDEALDAVGGGVFQAAVALRMPLALKSFTSFSRVLSSCGASACSSCKGK